LIAYSIAITTASVAAGDVMTSLLLWRHAAAHTHTHTHRQNDRIEWKHYICRSLNSLGGDKHSSTAPYLRPPMEGGHVLFHLDEFIKRHTVLKFTIPISPFRRCIIIMCLS